MTKTLTQVSIAFIRFLMFTAVVAMLGHHAHAQQNTITGYNQVVGQMDMANAARTNVNRQGAGSPNGRDACVRVGDSYFQTDASPGANLWYCTALPGTWTNGNSGGAGTVTSVNCGTFGASWLTCSFGGSTATTPVLAVGAATGQTSHQVIGTCGSATSFTPCSLTSAELPLSSMGTITGGTWSGAVVAGAYGGTGVANTGSTLTLGGNVAFTGSFNPTFSIPSSSTWTFQSGGGTLAQTGADINTSNQVTSTHLSSALPFSQGGLGTSANFPAHNWFGNNAGSTSAPSAQQPACADLSNAANSCSTDATNAANISSGMLNAARLPPAAGGGPAGGVASTTSTSGAINASEASIVSYTIPANTVAAGTVYRIVAFGTCTASAANASTFRVYLGPAGDNTDAQIGTFSVNSATSGTNIPFRYEALITFRSASASEYTMSLLNNGASGINVTGSSLAAPVNSTGLTTTANGILHMSYASAASTTTSTFQNAIIELVKQ